MQRRLIGFGAAILLALLIGGAACAQDLTGISLTVPESARTASLGGLHAALTDDINALSNNPAGFIAAKPQISLSEISLNLKGPIFDIAGVVSNGVSGNIAQLLGTSNVQSLLRSIYTAMDLAGPIYFGYVGNGLGFGVFNGTDVTIESTAPLTFAIAASEQLLLSGGYSFRIPLPSSWNSTLDAGLLLKGSLKGTALLRPSLFDLPTLFSSIGPGTVTGAPFYFTSAIGMDAGIRFSYRNILTVGIVGRDIYSPALTSQYPTLDSFLNNSATPTQTSGVIPFDLSTGILFTPSLGFLERYISNFKLMLDYNDIVGFLTHADSAKNVVLNFGLGTELTLLEVLAVRAGFYQGLFSAGLGLDLKVFRIDAAMFGTELSSQPGLRPVYNLLVDIEFRI